MCVFFHRFLDLGCTRFQESHILHTEHSSAQLIQALIQFLPDLLGLDLANVTFSAYVNPQESR